MSMHGVFGSLRQDEPAPASRRASITGTVGPRRGVRRRAPALPPSFDDDGLVLVNALTPPSIQHGENSSATAHLKLSGDIEEGKRKVSSANLATSLDLRHVCILTDNLGGLRNPERVTLNVITSLCAIHRPGGSGGNYAWVDPGHLDRYGGIFTATLPFQVKNRHELMRKAIQLARGDHPTLLPSGYDPEIEWARRELVEFLGVGNGALLDQFAATIAGRLARNGCPVLGLRNEIAGAESMWGYLLIPLSVGEVRRSVWGFLLDDLSFRRAYFGKRQKVQQISNGGAS